MFEKIKQYLEYRRTLDELYSMSDRELSDIGVHRSEIKWRAKESIYGAEHV